MQGSAALQSLCVTAARPLIISGSLAWAKALEDLIGLIYGKEKTAAMNDQIINQEQLKLVCEINQNVESPRSGSDPGSVV
jgi:hypothetical protein